MPAVDPTKANFDKAYVFDASGWWYAINGGSSPGGEPSVYLNYNRFVKIGDSATTAAVLASILNIQGTESIGMIGAGYGWVGEKMLEMFPNLEIVCVDTSPWIQGNKATTEEQDVIDALDAAGITDPTRRQFWIDNLSDGGTRARIDIWDYDLTHAGDRNKLLSRISGSSFDHLITLDVLPWATDNEMVILSSEMHKLTSNVWHWVTPFMADQQNQPEPSPVYNWHTLAEYKALMPSDTFIDRVPPHQVL